ncbi:MAG: DMT family transporter [Bacteroidota bacterium]|nr:DMT family transporter [Bacteroidota bacterium]
MILLLMTIIGGANYTILKLAVPNYISPDAMVMTRLILGFIFFSICTIPDVSLKSIEKSDYKILFLSALFGVASNQFFFYHGMALTTPVNGSIFNLCMPITILILTIVLYKTKITPYALFGFGLALVGAIFLLDFSSFSMNESTFVGDIMILINSVSFGTYVVLIAPLSSKYNAFKISQIIFGIGMLLYIPIGIDDLLMVAWHEFNITVWFVIAYVMIFTTFIVYYLNNLVPKIASTQIIGMYVYLQPVVAAIVAVIVRNDTISIRSIICGLLIIGGIYLVQNEKIITDAFKIRRK